MDTSALFRVDGMVAVVTGGGTGIGYHMALGLASAGARKVYILGRRKAVLEEAAKSHPALCAIECDVGSKTSLQAAVDAVARESGHVNLLVANSGVLGPTARWTDPHTVSASGQHAPEEEEREAGAGQNTNQDTSLAAQRKKLFEDVDMDDFTQTFHVNVTGAYFTMLAFLELLEAGNANALQQQEQQQQQQSQSTAAAADHRFGAPLTTETGKGKGKGKGEIPVPAIQSQVIFTSSISAYSRAWVSAPAYAASKAAIAHLTKHASTNLAPYGIRVNALAPGLFPSELATVLTSTRDPSKEAPSDPLFIPARRFGGAEEMAGTLLYLASRAGAFCNGLILVHDGGKLSTIPSEY